MVARIDYSSKTGHCRYFVFWLCGSHVILQVEAFKAAKIDLETRVRQLTVSNEKLADDEGRWYSLARELENQMDVIKKVRRLRVVPAVYMSITEQLH